MLRLIGCLVFLALALIKNSFANTAIYQKDNFLINATGYIDGQIGSKEGAQTRHNFYGGISLYDKVQNVPVSMAIRVNNGSNAAESYGGTAIEDAYLRIGDGSTDSDDRFLSFKKESRGRFEFGITGPMTEKLRVSSTDFSRGTGGVSGDWFRYVNYNLDSSTTILNPQMPITNGFTTSTYASPVIGVLQDYYSGSQALKANLYSPKFYGFILGIGYTPSLYDRYSIIGLRNSYNFSTQNSVNNFNTKNSISSVLYYDNDISQNFHLTSSLMFEKGQSAKLNKNYNYDARENLNALMYGVALTYDNWHIGGSYCDYGKSLYLKEDGTSNTMKINSDGSLSSFAKAFFYDLGIGYSKKDRGFSLTYFASRYLDNSVTTMMLSFDRSFMINKTIGIKSYIEGGFSEIKHQNFFDSSNKLISNDVKAALIFAGVRFMI